MISKQNVFKNLYDSRLLRNNDEIEEFENNLVILAEHFEAKDILQLCKVLDDETNNAEVMFGVVHLIETLSSELAYRFMIEGVVSIRNRAPNWAKIIMYRCLNDEPSKKMLKEVSSRLDERICESFYDFLTIIKKEDYSKFGKEVDFIID